MSPIHSALEKLDQAVSRLDLHAKDSQMRWEAELENAKAFDNVVDVDFVAHRLDAAISMVETVLGEDDQA